MLLAIASFELKRRLWMVSTWVYFGVLFCLSFLLTIGLGGAFGGRIMVSKAAETIHANAPYLVQDLTETLGYFAILIAAGVFGQAAHQDVETRFDRILFSLPLTRMDYLGGRFLGALLTMLFILAGVGLGAATGAVMPFVDRVNLGPATVGIYVWPYLVTVLPNLVVSGAVFFLLATLSRKMMPVYTGAVLLVMGWLLGQNLVNQLNVEWLSRLLDWSGTAASQSMSQYWTTAEKNARLLPLSGAFLANRVVWLLIGFALLAIAFLRFQFRHDSGGGNESVEPLVVNGNGRPPNIRTELPITMRGRSPLWLLPHSSWRLLVGTIRNVSFLVIGLAGLICMVVVARFRTGLFETNSWPVTYLLLDALASSFMPVMLLNVVVFSGEIAWREREARMDSILDSLPFPGWLSLASKLLALVLLQALQLCAVLVVAVLIQLAAGYHRHEFGLFASELFGFRLVTLSLWCVMGLAVQVAVGQKHLGQFVLLLIIAFSYLGDRLGFDQCLYRFAMTPVHPYSDMNGYGRFASGAVWFDAYWAALAFVLALVTSLLWVRGVDEGFRCRLKRARDRMNPLFLFALVLGLLGWVGIGLIVFWKTNILNHEPGSAQREDASANCERRYRPHSSEPQLRIVDEKLQVQLLPERPSALVKGSYWLRNEGSSPISRVQVNVPLLDQLLSLVLGLERASQCDDECGVCVFELDEPIRPGASMKLEYDLRIEVRGVSRGFGNTEIVENGTFLHSTELVSLGYQQRTELKAEEVRTQHHLLPRSELGSRTDDGRLVSNFLSQDADWINLEVTVSTALDQIAVAPGDLVNDWVENQRHFWQYRMPSKMPAFWSILSARYAVKRGNWKEVDIEIYHHPDHDWNLDRMMKGMQQSLEYYSSAFGPYQFHQLRIAEFPRYSPVAQAFPTTIAFSEAAGFIARVDSDSREDLDYPVYVTAHEVAHQWWAYQVIGANVQGAMMLSESLAQYSALMVMKHVYGEAHLRKIVRHELEIYLRGRVRASGPEHPLSLVERDEEFVSYQKGAVVFYALSEYMGEETLNKVLRAFVEEFRYQGPPYATASMLVKRLQKAAPPSLNGLVDDLFNSVVLYENKAVSARAVRKDGRWQVTVRVAGRKLRANQHGDLDEESMNDAIDIALLDGDNQVIARESHLIHSGEAEFVVTADRLPARAGIDPMHLLVDQHPDDNFVEVNRD